MNSKGSANKNLLEAIAFHSSGKLEEALICYRRALETNPISPEALTGLGAIHARNGRLDQAEELFVRALRIGVSDSLLLNYANVLRQTGRIERAISLYQRVHTKDPWCLLAISDCLSQLRRHTEALNWVELAISRAPMFSEAHNSKGILLLVRREFEQALISFTKAITIRPDNHQALYNRGITLKAVGQYDAALSDLNKAIEINPRYVRAWIARSNVLEALRRNEEALESCDAAIRLGLSVGDAYLNKALILLRNGRLIEGFQLYEHRWESTRFTADRRDFKAPLWLGGSSLNGKTILLHSEQGLGDTIQFCRYVPMVKDLGCTVILEAQRPLLRLLTKLTGPDIIVERGKNIQKLDFHCPLMSLPFVFHTEIKSIPNNVPYLQPAGNEWIDRTALAGERRPVRSVGICWSGNPQHEDDHNRSIRLMDLLDHLTPEFEWVCLQKEISSEERQLLTRSGVKNYSDKLEDFSDTATLISTLDVVISVDSSVAHLAGAMKIPTLVLLPFVPDFRWMWEREDSPWYPTIRLFRQRRPQNWNEPISELFNHLNHLRE